MTSAPVLLLSGVLAAIVFANPFLGLCMTIASVPLAQTLPAVPLASSATAFLGGLTLVSCLVGALMRRRVVFSSRDGTYGWVFAFGLASLAGLALSTGGDPFQGLYTYGQLVVLAWLTNQLVVTRKNAETLMVVWILIMVVTQVVGLAGFDFSVLGRENRLAGPNRSPNELAFYSVSGICFALYFLLNARSVLSRALAIAVLGLATMSVFLSGSRGGLLVLAAVVFFAMSSLRTGLVRGLRFSGVLLLFLAVLLLTTNFNFDFVPGLVRQTRQGVADVAAGRSSDARVRITRWGLRSWGARPIFGVGFGTGVEAGAFSGNPSGRNASHSSYLTALVETGIVGLFLFCGLLLATWRNLSQRPPEEQRSVKRRVELLLRPLPQQGPLGHHRRGHTPQNPA
ncbi:O-antigen ligase family protein [candidate division WOR-3 bacterium]|nr:O-antigen ligase family protein [candidate division WOR-3 bacterium]